MVPTRCSDQFTSIFFFWLKYFSSLSRFLVVVLVKRSCQLYQHGALISVRAFLFFGLKHFSSISSFLEFRAIEREVLAVLTDALNLMRVFSFSLQKIFFRFLDFCLSHRCMNGVSCTNANTELYASIFVFC